LKKLIFQVYWLCLCVTGIAQNIGGNWQGVVYQVSGGPSTYYPASMELTQTAQVITGISIIKMPDGSPSYARSGISGSLNSLLFYYQHTGILDQIAPPARYYWCPNGYANLVFDPITQTLKGPSNSPGCAGPGSVELWRLAVLSDTIFCKGEPVNIEVSGKDVQWYTDNALTSRVATGNRFSPKISATTTYYVTQTHYNTQSPAIAIRITIRQPVVTSLDKTICAGQSVDGYTQSGTYTDTLRSTAGCDSIRRLKLFVNQPRVDEISRSICPGETYEGYATAGRHVDTLTDVSGCRSVRIINLALLSLPRPVLPEALSLCVGDTVRLIPGSFNNYTWNTGSVEAAIVAATPGRYRVTVTNACGSASAETNVTFGDCNVALPTAFSPNGDGLNDVFKPRKLVSATSFNFEIFNRWGQRVFKSTSPSLGWDGRVNGQIQQPGIYVWKLEFTRQNRADSKRGVVMLTN
jgi:gliding motility-associated-like protein